MAVFFPVLSAGDFQYFSILPESTVDSLGFHDMHCKIAKR